jgi:hypothetical protein
MQNIDYTVRSRKFDSYDKVLDFLEDRTKEIYKIDGINKLSFNKFGDLEMSLDVLEDDRGMNYQTKHFENTLFIPKYVWSHLANFLGLPTNIYEYYKVLSKRLNKTDLDVALSYESDVLSMLYEERNERKALSKRLKDIYIGVFEDGFGKFPRTIFSERYREYSDSDALKEMQNNLNQLSSQKYEIDYQFKDAYLSPYQSSFNFIDNNANMKLEHVNDEIRGGIRVTNSETKSSSLRYGSLIMRLACTNGLIRTFKDQVLKIMHVDSDNFALKCKQGFVKCLQLTSNFAESFAKLDKYSNVISNNWNDIIDIPSSYLALNNNEKKEIIEIANKENYQMNAYGIVQALTFKSSHGTMDDKAHKKYNDKALKVMENAKKISKWIPKRLDSKETSETSNNDSLIDGNNLFEM